jgi:hypothetical protein
VEVSEDLAVMKPMYDTSMDHPARNGYILFCNGSEGV